MRIWLLRGGRNVVSKVSLLSPVQTCSLTNLSAEVVIPGVYLASSITLSRNRNVVQRSGNDSSVAILNMIWNGKDTIASPSEAFVLHSRTRGSHLAALYMGTKFAVYSQVGGDDVVRYLKNDVADSETPNDILPS
jgi:hypothetical protein